MISFLFETQRPVTWTAVTSCFMLLGALCSCNAVHQKTVKMSDPLKSGSVQPPLQTTGQPQPTTPPPLAATTTATGATLTATARPPSDLSWTAATAPLPTAGCHSLPPDATTVSHLLSLSTEEKGRRLIQAAEQGAVEQVTALLSAGADVQASDGRELTPLHWAAFRGRVEATQCLLQAGAEVDAKDDQQWTPLYEAVVHSSLAMVKLLLAASADPNVRDVTEYSPLHWAARYGRAEVAAALLQAGADRGARNKRGQTALDVARIYKRRQLIQMLQ